MVDGVFLFAGMIGVFALITFQSARKSYTRYQTATELIDDSEQLYDESETTTIHGPVSVAEPAIPEQMLPADVDANDGDPAVWAWRVRIKERRGSESRVKLDGERRKADLRSVSSPFDRIGKTSPWMLTQSRVRHPSRSSW